MTTRSSLPRACRARTTAGASDAPSRWVTPVDSFLVSEPLITESSVAEAVDAALAAIAEASDTAALKSVRSAHLGEASALARLNGELRNVPNDQKAALGKLVGQARGRVNQAFTAREHEV